MVELSRAMNMYMDLSLLQPHAGKTQESLSISLMCLSTVYLIFQLTASQNNQLPTNSVDSHSDPWSSVLFTHRSYLSLRPRTLKN